MKRSAGVTVIAALALVGSAATLLIGVLTLAIMMFAPIPAAAQGSVPQAFMKGIFFALSLMYLLPAVWGIATGIGLIRLKNWARISTIVFSVLLIAGGCFGGLIIAVMPFPSTPARNVDPAAISAIRIAMVSFWLALAGIGAWWVVFFTRTSVKAQFLTAQSPSEVGIAAQALPGVVTSGLLANSAQRGPQRPLSITIIAWVLLAGCILSPLNFLLHAPVIVLTKMLTGWAAALSYLAFAVIHFFTGWGLLRLRPWARQLGIALYGFGFMNIVAFYFTPGASGRFQALMGRQNSMFPWVKAIPNQPHLPFEAQPFLTLIALFGMAVIALPIYFLVTRRAAFE